jgi:hypothetical protein
MSFAEFGGEPARLVDRQRWMTADAFIQDDAGRGLLGSAGVI